MADEVEKSDKSQEADATEISLENIDEILQEEDPTFVDSLNSIKEVADEESDVELESFDVDVASASDDSLDESDSKLDKVLKKYPKLKKVILALEKVRSFFAKRVFIWKGRLKLGLANLKDAIKSSPDRFKKYWSQYRKSMALRKEVIVQSFDSRTRLEKSLIMAFLFGLGVTVGLAFLNIKDSRWIPFLSTPILTSLEGVADKTWSYKIESETVPFLSAFPQEKHSYLFPKVVVNLRNRTDQNAFTMGAFEFYVEVDSKDTAIEVKSRQVELHDAIQRVVEQFTYQSLQSERGKKRLKEEIKKTLNKKVVQGWVKDVYIKFFITKP